MKRTKKKIESVLAWAIVSGAPPIERYICANEPISTFAEEIDDYIQEKCSSDARRIRVRIVPIQPKPSPKRGAKR